MNGGDTSDTGSSAADDGVVRALIAGLCRGGVAADGSVSELAVRLTAHHGDDSLVRSCTEGGGACEADGEVRKRLRSHGEGEDAREDGDVFHKILFRGGFNYVLSWREGSEIRRWLSHGGGGTARQRDRDHRAMHG